MTKAKAEEEVRELLIEIQNTLRELEFKHKFEYGGANFAAHITRLSLNTIRQYTCDDKIPFKKIGSDTIYYRDELEKWMQSRENND